MQIPQELQVRLPDFILSNLEPILEEWETHARSLEVAEHLDWLALRDHAEQILRATVKDMNSPQTSVEKSKKSREIEEPDKSDALDGASELHACDRLSHGFDMMELMSEYRALRASVLQLWRDTAPAGDHRDLEDMTRFNESIDQSLATAIGSYTQRVDQARITFLAILGHDLRNPLSAISMAASLIPLVRLDEPQALECSSIIARSATAMERMISDLLDFTRSRLGSGMPLSLAPSDLGVLSQDLIAECRISNPNRKICFSSVGNLQGAFDSDRIRQAISNLMGNAMQHGSAGFPVTLSVVGEQSRLIIKVHNGGAPIPARELHRIFEPLVRGAITEGPNGRPSTSMGLGLYIARIISESHGGQISVCSNVEHGTSFTISLPREVGT